MGRSKIWVSLCLGGLLLARASHAEVSTPASARERFREGAEAAERGDLSKALEAFTHAYALSPNQTVLYNIAQTYSALGRPVEAIRTLRAYLAADAPSGDAARRREVEALLRLNEARVGRIELELQPPDSNIEVDGRALTDWAGGFSVSEGRHVLVASRADYPSQSLNVDVPAGQSVHVRLALTPADRKNALVELRCGVPAVSVTVDDVRVGRVSPTLLVVLAAGEHRIQFSRRGYRSSEFVTVAQADSQASVDCRIEAASGLSPSDGGELRVLASEPDARVLLDGLPFRTQVVPIGAHVVTVTRPGFEVWRRSVAVEPGRNNLVFAPLVPSAQTRRLARQTTRRTWAYVTAGAGVGLGGLAAALLIENHARYRTWQSDHHALTADLNRGAASPALGRRAADLQDRASSIQRRDDVAIGTAILGGMLLAVSGSLFYLEP